MSIAEIFVSCLQSWHSSIHSKTGGGLQGGVNRHTIAFANEVMSTVRRDRDGDLLDLLRRDQALLILFDQCTPLAQARRTIYTPEWKFTVVCREPRVMAAEVVRLDPEYDRWWALKRCQSPLHESCCRGGGQVQPRWELA